MHQIRYNVVLKIIYLIRKWCRFDKSMISMSEQNQIKNSNENRTDMHQKIRQNFTLKKDFPWMHSPEKFHHTVSFSDGGDRQYFIFIKNTQSTFEKCKKNDRSDALLHVDQLADVHGSVVWSPSSHQGGYCKKKVYISPE